MPPDPFRSSAAGLDLSPRALQTIAITGSPAAAAETIIATTAKLGNIPLASGVFLLGWAAYTIGASGTAVRFRLRQTDGSGTVIADSGACTAGVAAAALDEKSIQGIDTAPAIPGQVYVLTMTVTAGSAPSTVSAVSLIAIPV